MLTISKNVFYNKKINCLLFALHLHGSNVHEPRREPLVCTPAIVPVRALTGQAWRGRQACRVVGLRLFSRYCWLGGVPEIGHGDERMVIFVFFLPQRSSATCEMVINGP